MSTFKNVLRSSLLVTASLAVIGCGDDDKGKDSTVTPPSSGPTTPSTTTLADLVQAPDIGRSVQSLVEATIDAPDGRKNRAQPMRLNDTNVTGEIDFFNVARTSGSTRLGSGAPGAPAAPATDGRVAAANGNVMSVVGLKKYDASNKLTLNTTNLKGYGATGLTGAALMIDPSYKGANQYKHLPVTLTKGDTAASADLKVYALAVDNMALMSPNGETNTIHSLYASIGANAAVGYEFPHQTKEGKAIAFTGSGDKPAAAAMALNKKSKKGHSTKGHKKNPKDYKDKHAAKAHKTTSTKHHHTKSKASGASGGVVLTSLDLDKNDGVRNWLETGKLHTFGFDPTTTKEIGAYDIAGRALEIVARNTVISSGNPNVVEIVFPEAAEKTGTTTGTALGKKKRTKSSKAKASHRTTAKGTSASYHKSKTESKHTHKQHLVKKAGGKHDFLFKIKEKFYAEVGTLTANAGTEFLVLPHKSLFVTGKLDAKDNVGVRVFDDGDTLTHTDIAWADINITGDRVKTGQALMDLLEKDKGNQHGIDVSSVLEESSKTETKYKHANAHTPFPLWLTGDVTFAAGKTFVFSGLDVLNDSEIGDDGVYVTTLAKDYSGTVPYSESTEKVTIALDDDKDHALREVVGSKVVGNGYHDLFLFLNIKSKATTAGGATTVALSKALMGSRAQGGRAMLSAALDRTAAMLDPSNLLAASSASLTAAHANQFNQLGALARGAAQASAANLGSAEQYAVSFNNNGTKVGFTYSTEGGNAFTSAKGATSVATNVAQDMFGLTAIVSANASVDNAKNIFASASNAEFGAGLTLAKAYNFGGLSVVPMAGLGVASKAISGFSAVVPMAAGSLGLNVEDTSLAATTFNAAVNFALDDAVSDTLGVSASLTLGVAGYMASNTNANLSTSEGKSFALDLGGQAYTPFAQFNFASETGAVANAVLGSQSVAFSFGLDR